MSAFVAVNDFASVPPMAPTVPGEAGWAFGAAAFWPAGSTDEEVLAASPPAASAGRGASSSVASSANERERIISAF